MNLASAKVVFDLKFIKIIVDNFSSYVIYLIKMFSLKLFKINLNTVPEILILGV